MYLYNLPNDILFLIINNIELYKINNIELISKDFSLIINKYIKYQYKCSLKILKENLNDYNKHINILYTLLNKNNNVIQNLIYYSIDNKFTQFIKKIYLIDKINIFEYKNYIYNLINKYYSLFNYIISNINNTYIIFLNLCKYKRCKNIYYLHINIKNSYINFYNFLILYKYLKFLINNLSYNYINYI